MAELIVECPMCRGIGEVYAVDREGGPFWVPRSRHYLTEPEKVRAQQKGGDTGWLVIDRCHGCNGRGLVSAASLAEPFTRESGPTGPLRRM